MQQRRVDLNFDSYHKKFHPSCFYALHCVNKLSFPFIVEIGTCGTITTKETTGQAKRKQKTECQKWTVGKNQQQEELSNWLALKPPSSGVLKENQEKECAHFQLQDFVILSFLDLKFQNSDWHHVPYAGYGPNPNEGVLAQELAQV